MRNTIILSLLIPIIAGTITLVGGAIGGQATGIVAPIFFASPGFYILALLQTKLNTFATNAVIYSSLSLYGPVFGVFLDKEIPFKKRILIVAAIFIAIMLIGICGAIYGFSNASS